MAGKASFSKIYKDVVKNLQSPSVDIPQDFTIRVIKNFNEIEYYQLLFTHSIKGKLILHTCSIPGNHETHENLNISNSWKILIDDMQLKSAPATLDETLLAERMRILKQGITFYDLHSASSSLIFTNDGLMYSCYLEKNGEISSLKMLDMNNALSVKRNPINWNLLSFLKNKNVFLFDILGNKSIQMTFSDNDIGSGCTHYIIQEEFDRVEGMWWRPHENNKNEYHLLIEEYNESEVSKLIIPCYTFGFEHEEYRYPQPGMKNAKSTLKILKIKRNPETDGIWQYEILELHQELFQTFPEFEYLTNAGWTPDGNFIWIQLIDRLQNKLSTYLLSLDSFAAKSRNEAHQSIGYAVLLNCEINTEFWVPVNQNTVFLKCCLTDSNRYSCSYILGQSISGFNHLYLMKSTWNIPIYTNSFVIFEPDNSQVFNLTQGDWEVDIHKIWVNEKDEMIYFLANKDDILADHLYRLSYKGNRIEIHQVTTEDTIAYLNPEENVAVVNTSSLSSSINITFISTIIPEMVPKYSIFELSATHVISFDGLLKPKQPKLLSYNIDDAGHTITLYGLLFLPDSDIPKKWPTLHYVYGGPSVRMVENCYNKNFLYFAQQINRFGFALLVSDGRGSSRRGLKFHGHVKNKMGTVELLDQIDFLRKAAVDTELIDIDRVAIYGSSYGGYLTIMAMFQHSDVYKCGFSCSPVVDFQFYDTAYTERYMGIPEENRESYIKASVLSYIRDLPQDRCRLIVAHGGKDENVHFLHTANLLRYSNMLGLDIRFLFYPNSRHGINDRAHLVSHLVKFLFKHLT